MLKFIKTISRSRTNMLLYPARQYPGSSPFVRSVSGSSLPIPDPEHRLAKSLTTSNRLSANSNWMLQEVGGTEICNFFHSIITLFIVKMDLGCCTSRLEWWLRRPRHQPWQTWDQNNLITGPPPKLIRGNHPWNMTSQGKTRGYFIIQMDFH